MKIVIIFDDEIHRKIESIESQTGQLQNQFQYRVTNGLIIEADPEITRPSYEHMADGYKPEYDDPYTTDMVVAIYEKEGTHIYTYDTRFENFSYIAIWVLPFLLMLPWFIKKLRQ